MATPDDPIAGVELTGDRYTVEQSLIRNRYRALDADGNVVIRGKQRQSGCGRSSLRRRRR